MLENMLNNEFLALRNLFIDEQSMETFTLSFIVVYAACSLLNEDEELIDSDLKWDDVSEVYLKIDQELKLGETNIGDVITIVVKGNETRSGRDEILKVGQVVQVPTEIPLTDGLLAEDYLNYVDEAHVFTGEYKIKG